MFFYTVPLRSDKRYEAEVHTDVCGNCRCLQSENAVFESFITSAEYTD